MILIIIEMLPRGKDKDKDRLFTRINLQNNSIRFAIIGFVAVILNQKVPTVYKIAMEDKDKTKEQLINELAGLRQIISKSITRDAEHKKVKESLSESEKRYHAFFEQAADSIVLIDTKTEKLVEFNEKAHGNLGYTREEFQKLKIPDFEIIESEKEVKKHFKKIIKEGFDLFETKHRTKDGQLHDIQISAKAITVGGKEFIQAIWSDITERKQAERKVKSSEERLKILFEMTPETIYLMDLNGTFIDFNRAAETLSGYTKEEAIGKDFISLNLFTPDQIPKVHMLLDQIAMGNPVGPEELTLTNKEGIDVALEIRAYPVAIDNKKLLLGAASDITKRKSMEDALKTAKTELEMRINERTSELAESNTALKVLLRQRAEDQKEFEHNISSNIRHLIMPYLTRLKNTNTSPEELTYLNILESNLQEIVEPFSQKLSSRYLSFTHKEIQIADLIKDGKQDKDIIEILNISLDTVKTHRRNIRKKLDINNKKINLRTKLLSFS